MKDLLKVRNGDGKGWEPVIKVCLLDLRPFLPNEGEWLMDFDDAIGESMSPTFSDCGVLCNEVVGVGFPDDFFACLKS